MGVEAHTGEEHTAKAAEHSIGPEHTCSGELHLPSREDPSASSSSLSSLALPSLLPHSPKLLLYPPSSCYACVTPFVPCAPGTGARTVQRRPSLPLLLTGGCRKHLRAGCCRLSRLSTVDSVTAGHRQWRELTAAGASEDVDSTRNVAHVACCFGLAFHWIQEMMTLGR